MKTTNWSIEDITDSINNYLNIITDPELLITKFGQGNCYAFDPSLLPSTTLYVHAYPGIFENRLYFFMIPAEFDNKDSKLDGSLAANTQVHLLVDSGTVITTHRIPDFVAQARINNWKDYHNEWIPQQVASEYGMFEAFEISIQDFETIDDLVFLGLEEGKESPGGFDSDLIIANPDKTSAVVVFDDYVKPVPPYSSSAQQESFYLLSK